MTDYELEAMARDVDSSATQQGLQAGVLAALQGAHIYEYHTYPRPQPRPGGIRRALGGSRNAEIQSPPQPAGPRRPWGRYRSHRSEFHTECEQ